MSIHPGPLSDGPGSLWKKPVKRLFKGPWLWIVVAVVGVLIALQFLAPSGAGDEISASQMNEYIAEGEVKEITFVDGDQQIKATLDDDVDREGGREVSTKWIAGTQRDIFARGPGQVDEGTIEEVTSEVSRPGPAELVPLLVPADHHPDRACSSG